VKRWTILAATALTLAAVPAAARDYPWREQSEKVIEARGLTGVRVENARGMVTLHPSADGRIHLTALKVVRFCEPHKARKIASETEVITANEAGQFVIRVRYPQRQAIRIGFWDLLSGFELPRIEVRLALDVPQNLPVSAKSTSGDLASEEMTGPQVLETTSGDITVRGARGVLHLGTTSGDIGGEDLGPSTIRSVSGDLEIAGCRGPLKARTTSGDVTVREASDSLWLRTVSGDIRVSSAPRGITASSTSGSIVARSASGMVEVETASGDVEVDLGGSLRHAEVSTVSGDIGARLIGSMGCALDMKTSGGSIDVSIPLEMKSVSRRAVSGTVGRGGSPVILRTSSGDINVSGGGR